MLVIPVVIVIVFIGLFLLVRQMRIRKKTKESSPVSVNNRQKQLLEMAQKRLASNPRDIESLKILADNSYKERNYTNTVAKTTTLLEAMRHHKTSNEEMYPYYVMLGLSLVELKKYDDAFTHLNTAFALKKDLDASLLTGLGQCEYFRKSYDKAANYFSIVLKSFPSHNMARKFLGLCYYKNKKYNEAVEQLKQVVIADNSDMEFQFALANCYFEVHQYESALKLFNFLTNDSQYGSSSTLFAGSIYLRLNRYNEAIEAFQNGLKKGNLRPELLIELKYRLATAYVKKNDFTNALDYFSQVKSVNPSFKNVAAEVQRYSELVSNSNFNLYCNASSAEFIALLRKTVVFIFPKMAAKITNVLVERSDYIDMIVDIKNNQMSDSIYFRCYRMEATLDENHLRELYSKIKNQRLNRGYCVVPGTFSPSAEDFVEGRLIDLMGKAQLIKILAKVK